MSQVDYKLFSIGGAHWCRHTNMHTNILQYLRFIFENDVFVLNNYVFKINEITFILCSEILCNSESSASSMALDFM